MSDTLRIKVKQGEEISLAFKIREGNNPLDLSEYEVAFIVRNAPIEQAKAIIDKKVTLVSDPNVEGRIISPQQGEVEVHLTKEDTSFPVNDYYLEVALTRPHVHDIISAPACSSGRFEICEK